MIKICVQELSSRNNGFGIWRWYDLDDFTSSTEILEDLFSYTKETLENEGEDLDYYNFEEWEICDWECDFDIGINEYSNIDNLIEINDKFEELSDMEIVSLMGLLECGYNFKEAIEDKIEDTRVYDVRNQHDAMSDIAYDMVQEGLYGEIPDSVSNYLDYESMGRDIEINGSWFYVEHESNSYMVEVY